MCCYNALNFQTSGPTAAGFEQRFSKSGLPTDQKYFYHDGLRSPPRPEILKLDSDYVGSGLWCPGSFERFPLLLLLYNASINNLVYQLAVTGFNNFLFNTIFNLIYNMSVVEIIQFNTKSTPSTVTNDKIQEALREVNPRPEFVLVHKPKIKTYFKLPQSIMALDLSWHRNLALS